MSQVRTDLNCLMLNAAPFDDAWSQMEILQATLAVKDHFLLSVVKDIYENTGQQLSAVRVQLALLEYNAPAGFTTKIRDAGALVSQTMASLKAMSGHFFPERNLHLALNFVQAISAELNSPNNSGTAIIKVTGTPYDLRQDFAMVLFSGLLKIIAMLKSQEARITQLEIVYTQKHLQLKFIHEGNRVTFDDASLTHSRFFQVRHCRKMQLPGHCLLFAFGNIRA